MKTKHHGQMSESFLTAVFLSLSGGLQDAYTYLFRGKVFANAQTGNIVLLSSNIMDGQWDRVLHYLVPLCAFCAGRTGGRKDAGELLQHAAASLAAAGGAGRSASAVHCWLSATGAKPAGKRHRFLLLRNAGAGVPQGERLCICQHHVHW